MNRQTSLIPGRRRPMSVFRIQCSGSGARRVEARVTFELRASSSGIGEPIWIRGLRRDYASRPPLDGWSFLVMHSDGEKETAREVKALSLSTAASEHLGSGIALLDKNGATEGAASLRGHLVHVSRLVERRGACGEMLLALAVAGHVADSVSVLRASGLTEAVVIAGDLLGCLGCVAGILGAGRPPIARKKSVISERRVVKECAS